MKINNKILLYIIMIISICNVIVIANDAESIVIKKQIKKEAQRDLLLAFIQKQTTFQARQTAAQAAALLCNLTLLGIAISMMYDLSTIKQIMRSR